MAINECYYNQMKTTITFNEKNLKIGTKTVKYDNIYAVNEDYITNYAAIIKPTIIVTCTLVAALISILLFKSISLLFIVSAAFIGSVYVYYIQPKQFKNQDPQAYIKIIDFMYADTHDSIVVKADFVLDYNLFKIEKKTVWQKRILNRYISRLSKSRKYLVSQHEMHPKFTASELFEKYATVAQARYGFKSVLQAKSIEMLCLGYDLCASQSVKLGYRLARFCLVMMIVIIVYLFTTSDIKYQGIF